MLTEQMAAQDWAYARKQKAKRRRRITAYLMISAALQLLFLYSLERLLSPDTRLAVEPSLKTEVQERTVRLDPVPVNPSEMAVSADHKLLALVENDRLRIYNLVSGSEIDSIPLDGETPGVLQWLPDRNRLIYALMNNKTEVVQEPIQQPTGVPDETYSTDSYRQNYNYRTVTKDTFNISLYSVDEQSGSQPELIQTLHQSGQMPEKLQLSLSTYTNLLYVYWRQQHKDYLVQVDIMKRIKDIRLPRGELRRLVVSSRSGNMWAEMTEDGSAVIYQYQKGRWRLQKQLDGYQLLGVAPDERLVVAPDQAGQAEEVYLVEGKEEFKPAWVFNSPIKLDNASILDDGRLMYADTRRVIIYTPQLGQGTIFAMPKVDAFSPDRKMLVSWQQDSGELRIMEEVAKAAGP